MLFQPSATSSVLHLSPSMSYQCRAMLSFMQRYSWNDFAILSTYESGYEEFISALHHLTYKSTIANSYECVF